MAFDNVGYPNPLDDDSSKDSEAFGLKQMKAMVDRWRNGYGSESFALRKKRFDYNRAYATGKQDMSEFRDIIDVDGQLSVINIDYSPTPIAIPFIKKLKDKYMQRMEKITCNSIDPFTQSKKQKAKSDALFKLKEKDFIKSLQDESGVEFEEFKDSDPTDEQELDIDFGFNYKEREEVIMENLIDIVFYDNDMPVIKERLLDDFINCGYAVTRTYMDGNGRIKVAFVPAENYLTSYSEFSDLRDWQWNGMMYDMTISEIRQKYPKMVAKMGGEQKLFDLARDMGGKYGNGEFDYSWGYGYVNALARPYDAFNVRVIDICYKTLYNLKYEKNVDRFDKEILDRTEKYKPGKDYETSKPYYVSYTGCMIIDTDYLLEWGLSKNQIKPNANLSEVYSPYTVYMYDNNRMINTPLIETMIPSIKMMQNLQLQTQKLIATTAPDGFDIDVTGLSDIDMGEGVGVVSPMQLYGIYLQTGNNYYKGMEDDGEGRRVPPIQVSQKPFANKIDQLETQWQREYDKLTIIVGSNKIDQGLISNQAIGKGVVEDAREQGESASNYIYNSYINLLKGTAKKVQLRGWDILVYKKGGYEGYRQALGEEKIEYLVVEGTDDFERTNFDVKIEAVLDDLAAQVLEQNIQQCLAQKEITLEDAIQVRQLAKTNIKYATYYLASRHRKRLKEAQEQASINNKENTEAAVAAANAKAQGEMQLEKLKSELKSKSILEEIEAEKSRELIKFNSIMKTKVIEGLLTQGMTIQQVQSQAPWIFDGVGLIEENSQQIMAENIEYNNKQQQAIQEQQSMEEQSMMEEQQMQEQIPEEEMQLQ